MANQSYIDKKGLTIRDLITIGIFAALYFVANLIGGLPFAPNPVLTFYMPLGQALLGGPIMLLLLAKVPKRGSFTIVGIIAGLIFFIFGMHWAMDLGYVVMAIVADFVAGSKQYKSVKTNIFAYALMSLGSSGTYIIFFLDPAGWTNTMLNNGTQPEYIETMKEAAPIWVLAIILVGAFVVALFSGWVGSKMLKKQFEKAGITA